MLISPVFVIEVALSVYIPYDSLPAIFIVPALLAWSISLWAIIAIDLSPNIEIVPPAVLSIYESATL